MNQPSDRARLRAVLIDTIKAAFAKPRYQLAERLADKLMPTVRAAQADAWRRGYAAGKQDSSVWPVQPEHRNPYNGGRHAGPPTSAQYVLLPKVWTMP